MTREQSKHIQEVEAAVNYLDERIRKIQDDQKEDEFRTRYPNLANTAFQKEFKQELLELGTKVRNLALAELRKLQDKYLKIYAEL